MQIVKPLSGIQFLRHVIDLERHVLELETVRFTSKKKKKKKKKRENIARKQFLRVMKLPSQIIRLMVSSLQVRQFKTRHPIK